MKRVITISFLLLANFILVAHNVVPHHSHDELLVCFLNSHCDDCNDLNTREESEAATHHHEHDDDAASGNCCLIDHNYTVEYEEIKSTCHFHGKCNCVKVLFSLNLNPLKVHDFSNLRPLYFLHKPYLEDFHTDYIAQSLGLRAPPAY